MFSRFWPGLATTFAEKNYSYTAVSRKVVLQSEKSLCDNVESNMGHVGVTVASVNFMVFQRGGRKNQTRVFMLPPSLLLNRLEPQSSKAKLLIPIMQSALSCALLHFRGTTFVETAIYTTQNSLQTCAWTATFNWSKALKVKVSLSWPI